MFTLGVTSPFFKSKVKSQNLTFDIRHQKSDIN